MDKKEMSALKEILNKTNICLYIIIGLLAAIFITLIVTNTSSGSANKNNDTDTSTDSNYDVSMFTSIDATKFMSLLEEKEMSIIYFGRETCSYCVQFLPTLQKAQTDLGYNTYYVDISGISTSTDEFTSMVELIDAETEKYNSTNSTSYEALYGYTPSIVLVQKGEIKDVWVGYGSYDNYISWLAENGIK